MTVSVLLEISSRDHDLESMALGSDFASTLGETPGLTIDSSFEAIPLHSRYEENTGFAMGPEVATKVVRGDIDVESDDIAGLMGFAAEIEESTGAKVWSDPQIDRYASGIDCTLHTPKGASPDVADALKAPMVWNQSGVRGDDVVIGIVDGGVDGTKFPVIGGWSPDPNHPAGDSNVAWGGHGNMCAFDSLIAAPNARICDYAIGRTQGVPALLSAANQAFQQALISFRANGFPQVLSNSWGLYKQSWDPFPPGHPSNYSHNVNHVFNRKVVEVMDSGILVCFAAGNCGISCPFPRCGSDTGPGRSIRGANGMQRVISVGAVNLRDEWIGYSSQGPSTLASEKPDVCGFSHFSGQTNSDNGTSAACPVVAGVLALLRSFDSGLLQDRALQILKTTSRQSTTASWSPEFGYGIVDAWAAFSELL